MAIYLNEEQFGAANDVVGFPHLLVCTGVLLLTRGNMYGMHLASFADQFHTTTQFAVYLNNMGVIPGDMRALYGCCNFGVRYEGGGRAAWQQEMTYIANTIGYRGRVYGFDTSIINPQDGTYVEYIPNDAHDKCRVYYKRQEKTDRVDANIGQTVPGVFQVKRYVPNYVPATWQNLTMSNNIIATRSNRGNLHEVNYWLRMKNFDV